MQFVPLRCIGRRTRLSASFRYDRGTDPTYPRWKVRAIGDCDLEGGNQYTSEVQVAGSCTNMLAAKTDISSESICSASLSQTRERSRRAGRTHGNEDPKHWANVSRNGYPSLKGLRTPRFPSGPDIFDLQKKRGVSNERKMQNKLDEPRPPTSTDSRKTGSYKQLLRSTAK